MPQNSYEAFFGLLGGLDGYIDEISPYRVDGSQTILPNLPTELRWEVYEYLIPENGYTIECRNILNPWPTFPREPYVHYCGYGMLRIPDCSILHINESTRIDMSLYHIRTRLVCVRQSKQVEHMHEYSHPAGECRGTIIKYLESLPGEQGFLSVRRLRLRYLTRQIPVPGGSRNDDMDFVSRCRNIWYLGLDFDSKHLMKKWELEGSAYNNWSQVQASNYAFISSEDVVQRYQLYRILELKYVNKIALTMHLDDIIDGSEAVALIHEVGRWFEEGFRKRGRKVEVQKHCKFPSDRHMSIGYL